MTNGQRYDRSDDGFIERLFLFIYDCIDKYKETRDRKYLRKILLIDRWVKEEERRDEEYE